MATEQTKYKAKVEEVYSGDDIIVMVDLGVEELHQRRRVRLYGVDTPNAIGQQFNTPAGIIRTKVRELLRWKPVEITVMSRPNNSWIAIVELVTETGTLNINDYLIAEGFKYSKDKAAS